MRGVRVCATELDAHDTFRIFIKKIKRGDRWGGTCHVSVRVGTDGQGEGLCFSAWSAEKHTHTLGQAHATAW